MIAWDAFRRRTDETPKIYAHRGANRLAPENTLLAFKLGLDAGADGVELDVRICKDGKAVVFHDEDLHRLAHRPEKISDLPWNELNKVDLGQGQRIPCLEDALDFLLSEDAIVNIELKASKHDSVQLVHASASIVQGRPNREKERMLFSSFSAPLLSWLRITLPHAPTAYLIQAGSWASLQIHLLSPLFAFKAIHPHFSLLSPKLAKSIRKSKHLLNVWTVDGCADIVRMVEMGVDGIITNDVPEVLKYLNSQTRK